MRKYKHVVILINYSSYDETNECINSIAKFENESEVFIVIVDNSLHREQWKFNFSSAIINFEIIDTPNNGFGHANNTGIKWANQNLEYEYIHILNNDTVLVEPLFNPISRCFGFDSKIKMITSRISYYSNPDEIWYGGAKMNWVKGFPQIVDYNAAPTIDGALKAGYVEFISGCYMCLKYESMKEEYFFDENIFMYCEDLDVCLRYLSEGDKLYYSGNLNLLHKVQGSSKNNNSEPVGEHPGNSNAMFLITNMRSNQFYIMRKYLKSWKFYIFFIAFYLKLTLIAVRMIVGGRFDILRSLFLIHVNMVRNQPNRK